MKSSQWQNTCGLNKLGFPLRIHVSSVVLLLSSPSSILHSWIIHAIRLSWINLLELNIFSLEKKKKKANQQDNNIPNINIVRLSWWLLIPLLKVLTFFYFWIWTFLASICSPWIFFYLYLWGWWASYNQIVTQIRINSP